MAHLLLADTSLFLGRFHPLLVHLPIGILLLAAVLELLALNPRLRRLGQAVPAVLLLGVLTALPTLVSGWLLADSGHYAPQALAWHRNAGLLLTLLAASAWLMSIGWLRLPRAWFRISLGVLVLTLIFTGHWGANLTHGPGYLSRFAPAWLAGGGSSPAEEEVARLSDPDSALVFDELMLPVLQAKCAACHNEEVQRGSLNLTSREAVRAGGASGALFQAGDPQGSELFARLTLPRTDLRAMPPRGEPLSYGEKRLLAWWIQAGADYEATLQDLEKPPDVRQILAATYGWSDRALPYPEQAQTTPPDSLAIDRLRRRGWQVTPLAQSNAFISVEAGPGQAEATAEMLTLLLEVAEQITWLDLSGLVLDAENLSVLADMPHLTRLRLADTPAGDQALVHLQNLPQLRSLNLVGTKVSDEGIELLLQMPALQRLFLWNTDMTQGGRERLQKARPDLEIVGQFQFAETDPEQ